MIKEMIEDLKLHRVSYLVEIMQKGDFDKKIDALKKISKMKITKNIGLFLIDSSKYDYGINDNNGGISSELISLCFKNYYDEYTNAIKKVFDRLDEDSKNRVVFLLSSIDNESALQLYVDLVLKYYKDSKFIPVSNLFERPYLYTFLFPKLYKALRFKNPRNNILILLNDYLNAEVVDKVDLKKNKKLISDAILKVFNEALKYNFKNTTEALSNKDYVDLRFFLEISINIDCFIDSKDASLAIDKLFKKNDNQLNLFILDNYIRKGKDISKINLNKIAKDETSRYPLYDLLSSYNLQKYMPSKYLTKELMAKSDFYLNFMIYTRYESEIKNYKFIEKRIINNYEYYIFKFKYTYSFKNIPSDFLTNYVMEISNVSKYNNSKITKEFIGISGGYEQNKDSYKIAFNHNRLLFKELNKSDTIDKIIDDLKIKEDTCIKEEKIIEKENNEKNNFSYILVISLLALLILSLIVCTIYSYNPNLIQVKKSDKYISSKLTKPNEFKEIDAKDTFNMNDSEYYVLFYKKDGNKNKYYTYINKYLNNNIKVYYVNMNDTKNDYLKHQNELNLVIERDRFIKVKNKEYEYYVDGKNNILNEMNTYTSKLEQKK